MSQMGWHLGTRRGRFWLYLTSKSMRPLWRPISSLVSGRRGLAPVTRPTSSIGAVKPRPAGYLETQATCLSATVSQIWPRYYNRVDTEGRHSIRTSLYHVASAKRFLGSTSLVSDISFDPRTNLRVTYHVLYVFSTRAGRTGDTRRPRRRKVRSTYGATAVILRHSKARGRQSAIVKVSVICPSPPLRTLSVSLHPYCILVDTISTI